MAHLFILDLLLIDQPQSPQTVDVGEGQLARGLSQISPPGKPEFLAGGVVQDMGDSVRSPPHVAQLATQVLQGDLPTEAVVQISCGPHEDRHGLFEILG